MVHWQCGNVAILAVLHSSGSTTSSANIARAVAVPAVLAVAVLEQVLLAAVLAVAVLEQILLPAVLAVAILHVDDTLLSGNPSHSLPLSYLLLLTREGLWLLTVATVAGHSVSGHPVPIVTTVAGHSGHS